VRLKPLGHPSKEPELYINNLEGASEYKLFFY